MSRTVSVDAVEVNTVHSDHHVGAPMQAQLGQKIMNMGLGCPDADAQAPGDVLVAEPCGHQMQYFRFASSQR